jgi:hypothetical protein
LHWFNANRLFVPAQNARRTVNRTGTGSSDAVILSKGDLTAWSLSEAESAQLAKAPKEVPFKPKMREKITQPGLLIFKNPD